MAEWMGQASATKDAVEFLRKKTPMLATDFYALEESARARAFTVSGVAELDMVSEVWEAVERAVREGRTLNDFRKEVGASLEEAWGKKDPAHLENIFRTNVQSAYSAGRYLQNNRPEVRATHPYSKFSAVMDDRTTDVCAAAHGTVLPSDDPWWSTHQPPLHFRCRSDVTAITESEAKEIGIDESAPEAEADEGFGGVLDHYEPELSSRPVELAHLYELKNSQ